jgi:hypothetical protein
MGFKLFYKINSERIRKMCHPQRKGYLDQFLNRHNIQIRNRIWCKQYSYLQKYIPRCLLYISRRFSLVGCDYKSRNKTERCRLWSENYWCTNERQCTAELRLAKQILQFYLQHCLIYYLYSVRIDKTKYFSLTEQINYVWCRLSHSFINQFKTGVPR